MFGRGRFGTTPAQIKGCFDLSDPVTLLRECRADGGDSGDRLIWHLSFADGLENATVVSPATGLAGCFDLSNAITVTRTEE